MTWGYFNDGESNPYIDPWTVCPACMSPIRGEHETVTVRVPCRMILHRACASRIAVSVIKELEGTI